MITRRNELGELGENGTKGVSHSGTEGGTSSKSGECDRPHLRWRECMGQYTELGRGKWVVMRMVRY